MGLTGIWTYLYWDVFQGNEFFFYLSCSGVYASVLFFSICGLLMIVDITGRPRWMLKYKVQEDKNAPLDVQKLPEVVKVCVFNTLTVGMPVALAEYLLFQWMGCSVKAEDLPSVWRFLKDMLGIVIIEEIGFYYSHRLAHWGPLYKTIHKRHHEWTAPIGIVAIYCHPLEHLFCNVLPLSLGPILMSSHLFTMWVWYTVSLFTTIMHHSGYHLPLMPSPEFHDFHHLKFNTNYGVLGILDWLHGTDKVFRQNVQSRRHRTLFSLKSIKERYPDSKNKAKPNSANGLVK